MNSQGVRLVGGWSERVKSNTLTDIVDLPRSGSDTNDSTIGKSHPPFFLDASCAGFHPEGDNWATSQTGDVLPLARSEMPLDENALFTYRQELRSGRVESDRRDSMGMPVQRRRRQPPFFGRVHTRASARRSVELAEGSA
jgi:hypothetical protein